MYYYQIAGIKLESCCKLQSFHSFVCDPEMPDVTLKKTTQLPPKGTDMISGTVIHRKVPGGWFFHESNTDQKGLYVSNDYKCLKYLGKESVISGMEEWYVRIALECFLARKGYVSLHSAAVEVRGKAYAFTGPSGMGKSTRANAWISALDAKMINGDRPLIDACKAELYGVPWDGKEQCFRNVHYPLEMICEIRRSTSAYARKMSFAQRRKLLMRQCFIPMWDTETAAKQMENISHMAAGTEMVRVFCGPTEKDALNLYKVLQEKQFLKEEPDMKAKPGFVLRNVVDEFILMPTGDNIGQFNGTVLLNEVSAFVWEKLKTPISKEDLLKAVLDEYEVEKTVAAADLNTLLDTLKGYGIIEED